MAFNAKSFFAGVGTVVVALATGFTAAYFSSSILFSQNGAESNKLERHSRSTVRPQPVAASVVPTASPGNAQANAPAPAKVETTSPAAGAVRTTETQALRDSRAELTPQQARPERVKTERRKARAERKRSRGRPMAPRVQEERPAQLTERAGPFSPFDFGPD